MRHDWVHAVLQDLSRYAELNNLPQLHDSIEKAIETCMPIKEKANDQQETSIPAQP